MSTDLLGDPVPETPAMTAPLPWRVFQMSECDWWVARSAAEAQADYQQQTGVEADELYGFHELSDAEMERLQFIDSDEDERPTGGKRSFAAELARRVADDRLSAPEMFATTEW